MHIVVTDNNYIPKKLRHEHVEIWRFDYFYKQATSDEGVEIDESIFFNRSILTKQVKDGLKPYIKMDVPIYYYKDGSTNIIDIKKCDSICIYSPYRVMMRDFISSLNKNLNEKLKTL